MGRKRTKRTKKADLPDTSALYRYYKKTGLMSVVAEEFGISTSTVSKKLKGYIPQEEDKAERSLAGRDHCVGCVFGKRVSIAGNRTALIKCCFRRCVKNYGFYADKRRGEKNEI